MATQLKNAELAQVLLKILRKSTDPKRAAQDIANYLVAERRSSDLPAIVRELERLQFEEDGVLEVVATSAFPLSAEMKQELEKLFTAKRVKMIERHDQSLVGGVRVTALDKQADFTIRAKLQKLANPSRTNVN